jgi:hypothetical protein
MFDLADKERVKPFINLHYHCCSYANSGQSTYGSDPSDLGDRQQFERQQYQRQQPGECQQQYRLPLHSQAFPQSFHYGITGEVPDLSRNDARNPLVSTPQVGTSWLPSMNQPGLGQYEAQTSHHIPDAAFPGGKGQHTTGVDHPHCATLSEPQSSPGERPCDNAATW